jgi:ADP-heptose:LPS heptosyltransferase
MREATLMLGYSTKRPLVATVARIVDGILRVFVRHRLARQPVAPSRILVSKIDHLGDLALLARVMHNLHRLFPSARVDLLVGSWGRDLAECMPEVDGIIVYDSFFHNRQRRFPSKIFRDADSFRTALKEIRNNRYEMGIEMRAGMVTGIPLMRLGGIKHIVGFASGGFGPLLDVTVPWRPVNEIEKFLSVFHALGFGDASVENPRWNIPEENRKKASHLLDRKHPVILHPGSGRSEGWPIDSWNTLAKLLSSAGYSVYVTGISGEYPLGEEVIAGVDSAVNLCGSMDIKTFLAAVGKTELLIGLDSFSTHVSISSGVPTVMIARESSSEEFLPSGDYLIFPPNVAPGVIIDRLTEKGFLPSKD